MTIPEFVLQSFLDQILNFLYEKGKKLFNDASTKKKIREAIKNAAYRFDNEYPNLELANTLNKNTSFYDLESIRKSINYLLEHPFSPIPKIQIEENFKAVLPVSVHEEVDSAAIFFIERLQEELMGVEKLQMILSLIYGKRTADASERIAFGVEELIAKQKISQFEVDKAREKYLQYMVETNAFVDSRGIIKHNYSVALRLDEIYLTLTAKRETYTYGRDSIYNYSNGDTDKKNEHFMLVSKFRHNEILNLANIVYDNERVVILGEPGSGKTLLTKFLAWGFAKILLKKDGLEKLIDNEGNNYGFTRFPILLRVSNYADAFSRNRNLALRTFILESFNDVPVLHDSLRIVLENVLDNGEAIILLDGLDEVVDAVDRAEIGRRIEQFIFACNAKNRFIITSRIAGYQNFPIGGNFVHFTIRELELPSIKKFLEKWCTAAGRLQAPNAPQAEIAKHANTEIEEILTAADKNPSVRRLAANPLTLTILVLILREEGQLAFRRADLYEKALKIMFRNWQIARGYTSKFLIKDHEIIFILGPLAYWILENKPNGLAREKEIKQELSKYFARGFDVPPTRFEILEKADEFFIRINETGIIVEFAPGEFGFLHQTFQEYLVAHELIDVENRVADLIYQHRDSARWEEIITLVISLISYESPEKAMSLIRTSILAEGDEAIHKGFQPSPYESVLLRNLLFAIRVVGECIGLSDKKYFRFLLIKLFRTYLDIDGEGKYIPLARHVLHSLYFLRNSDAAIIGAQLLLEAINHKNENVRERIVIALGQLGVNTHDVIDGLLRRLEDENIHVQIGAAASLGDLGANSLLALNELLSVYDNKNKNESVRIAAIAALAYFKINVSSIVDKLLLILRNSSLDLGHSEEEYSWRILIVVAMALERLGFKQVVINELLMTLKNGDSRACYGAAVVLGELGVNNPEIVDALENALVNAIAINDSDILKAEILEVMQKLNVDKLIIFHSWLLSIKDRVKGGDIDYILERIIWEKDDEKMAGNLLKALEHEDVFVRLIALIAIGRLGVSTPNVVDALLIALKNEDLTLRGGAIQAISELNISEKKIVDELFIILETDNRQEVRGNVAILLSEFGLGKNPKVIAGLLEALRIESEMILHNAAGVSVQTGDPSTLIAMSSELWDENTYLQGKAANYLINLGLDEPVIKDGLFEMLNEETWPVKLSAVAVLGRIGIDSIDTLNVMFGLLEKEEFPVTWGIVVALGQSRVFTPELAKTLLVTIEDSKEEMRIKSALAIRHLCVGRASSSIPADWRNILVSALQKALESPANHETVYSKAESVHWPIYNVIWQALWDVTSDS